MPTVRATCADCGDVELRVQDLLVVQSDELISSRYRFNCPQCSSLVVKECEPRIVDLLVSSGVSLTRWVPPLELSESHPTGAVISHDDILAFHELLQSDGWFEEVLPLE